MGYTWSHRTKDGPEGAVVRVALGEHEDTGLVVVESLDDYDGGPVAITPVAAEAMANALIRIAAMARLKRQASALPKEPTDA